MTKHAMAAARSPCWCSRISLLALVAIWARGDSSSVAGVMLEVSGVLLLFGVSAIVSRRLLHGLLG